jgi:hypothetical protein
MPYDICMYISARHWHRYEKRKLHTKETKNLTNCFGLNRAPPLHAPGRLDYVVGPIRTTMYVHKISQSHETAYGRAKKSHNCAPSISPGRLAQTHLLRSTYIVNPPIPPADRWPMSLHWYFNETAYYSTVDTEKPRTSELPLWRGDSKIRVRAPSIENCPPDSPSKTKVHIILYWFELKWNGLPVTLGSSHSFQTAAPSWDPFDHGFEDFPADDIHP